MEAAKVVHACGVIANLEALNFENYRDWSFRVQTYLLAKDLWDFVEASNEAPNKDGDEAEFKAWRKNNAKALYAIQNNCGSDTYAFIRGITTAKDAWRILDEELNKPTHEASITEDEIPVIQPTTNNGDARVEDQLAIEKGHVEGDVESNPPTNMETVYIAFVSYILNDDWKAAMELHDQYPNLMNETPPNGQTALQHVIANVDWTSEKRVDMAKQLVELMPADSLEVRTADGGLTAMYSILTLLPRAIDLVGCMIEKNKEIVTSTPSSSFPRLTPLLMAQSLEFGNDMARYLYEITPHESLSRTQAAQLITEGLKFKRFDIAWDLIQRYPDLAITKNYDQVAPLAALTSMHSAFLSGSRLRFWEKWAYDGIHIEPATTINGTCIDVQIPEKESDQRHHHLICSVMRLFRGLIATNLFKLLGMFNRIYEMKLIHVRILEFLNIMCEVVEKKDGKELEGFEAALFLATQRGQVEYLARLCEAEISFIFSTNKNGQTLFQFAIECRQEKVYDLLYRMIERCQIKKPIVGTEDYIKNNVLHTVGRFSALAQINRIRGAALQMQRELQWFAEVESVVGHAMVEAVNNEGMTPRELFTKNHKKIVKDGETSMKETATACTVAGALLITMMFAAAFTVPGGYDEDTGHPIFLKEKVFTVFIVSDAVSLCLSTTSVIMFLGILTSRYAEDDFLKSLPLKMILGLLTLFLAIVTMMVSFSCALYILLHGNLSIIIPVVLLSSVPVISYVWMQFPFLVEIFVSTYGAGIFEEKVENRS